MISFEYSQKMKSNPRLAQLTWGKHVLVIETNEDEEIINSMQWAGKFARMNRMVVLENDDDHTMLILRSS